MTRAGHGQPTASPSATTAVVDGEVRRSPFAGEQEHCRPTYHFVPPNSWINDPKPFFWDSVYHVYFQYCPGVASSEVKHWGHASSADLVHWTEQAIALSPDADGPDADGCWTGSVVHDPSSGLFHILYTGIPHLTRPVFDQVQCLATSNDLTTWRKHPANPVIAAAAKPVGFGRTFRDPCVWSQDGVWYCVIGSNRPDGDDEYAEGAALLYRSTDLVDWTYLHPLYVGPEIRDECPDFFPLDGPHGRKWVLLSSRHETWWAVGTFDGLRFQPETHGVLDDRLYYAAKTLVDAEGRRILFGWIKEDRPRDDYVAAGWSGTLALPRQLTVLADGSVGQRPVPELTALRRERRQRHVQVPAGERSSIATDVSAAEIRLRISPTDASTVGIVVGGLEISYNRAAGRLAGRPLEVAPDAALETQIFVDRSVVEIFAGDKFCRTLRTYPSDLGAYEQLELFSVGADAEIYIEIWSMDSFASDSQ